LNFKFTDEGTTEKTIGLAPDNSFQV